MRVQQTEHLLAIVFFFATGTHICNAQPDAELKIVPSPNTNNHVTLQPQSDYHRVHFLIRAKSLKDIPCEAIILCTEKGIGRADGVVHRTVAYFTPGKDDQTFSIHLRTAKVPDKSVTYFLWVVASEPWRDARNVGQTAYKWKVERDADGRGEVIGQRAGTSEELIYSVAVPRRVEMTERVEILIESRTMQITVPADFRFGVNRSANYEVSKVVEPLN